MRGIQRHRWIPITKANDAELWCFSLIFAWTNGWANNRDASDLRRHRAHCDVSDANVNQMLNLLKTGEPLVSFVKVCEKTDRVITVPHCKWQTKILYTKWYTIYTRKVYAELVRYISMNMPALYSAKNVFIVVCTTYIGLCKDDPASGIHGNSFSWYFVDIITHISLFYIFNRKQ